MNHLARLPNSSPLAPWRIEELDAMRTQSTRTSGPLANRMRVQIAVRAFVRTHGEYLATTARRVAEYNRTVQGGQSVSDLGLHCQIKDLATARRTENDNNTTVQREVAA